ncbi:GNAT family N-acetyltransferase [Alkalicoccobacillus porphyridii]|uniref:GNAT family N-acetyltransferase n=1 Tax=Alkalicoccobacillus porphyridii TaxID=2597270 RepID=UPI0021B146D9|nr:GNAT family N-acetyltransferase [Alkalicoccobacillus porphyridii]
MYLSKLSEGDAEELFQFESINRAFFEQMIPSRGDLYYEYETFYSYHLQLLEEQKNEQCLFYLMRNTDSHIVGRVNLIDLDEEGMMSIGYRIGELFIGKGMATEAVRLIIEKAAAHPKVKRISGKTTENNIPSQKVLERNGFILTAADEDNFYTNDRGESFRFVQYILDVEGHK